MDEKNALCETTREAHNAEMKVLIALRDDVHSAKAELVALMRQLKCVKQDISRADDSVFKEHLHHHGVLEESAAIQAEIASFKGKCESRLQIRALNEDKLVQLGRDIDIQCRHRETLQRRYREILSQKDIISARLVAAEVEHRSVSEKTDAMALELRDVTNIRDQLQNELDATSAKTSRLLDEKDSAQCELRRQEEQEKILADLEQGLREQLDKNTVLTVEIGRPINLHRWRVLREKAPEQFMMLERIHSLQKKAIACTDKLASQSNRLGRKNDTLAKLRLEVSTQQSPHDLRDQLLGLKSECRHLAQTIQTQGEELQIKVEQAESINKETVRLEKRRMEIKAGFLVSCLGY